MVIRQCRKSELEERRTLIYSGDEKLSYMKLHEPPRSECALIGKRALSWAPWVPGISSNAKFLRLDQNNLEFSHEHLFWGDLKSNIGWGPSGLFTEAPDQYRYRFEDRCYDGSIMRKALATLRHNYRYNFILNNCQTFIDNLRGIYQRLGGK